VTRKKGYFYIYALYWGKEPWLSTILFDFVKSSIEVGHQWPSNGCEAFSIYVAGQSVSQFFIGKQTTAVKTVWN